MSRTSSTAVVNSFNPRPVNADTGMMGASGNGPSARLARIDRIASLSLFDCSEKVMATTARCTPSKAQAFRCSRVWGITPARAEMTTITASSPPAPASIVFTSFSCPGTSTMETERPLGSVHSA